MTVRKATSACDFLGIESDYKDDDFNGKHFVFTGTLLSMACPKAYEVAATGGGIPQDYRVLNRSHG
jgi:NAD-dependent DNA ligase